MVHICIYTILQAAGAMRKNGGAVENYVCCQFFHAAPGCYPFMQVIS